MTLCLKQNAKSTKLMESLAACNNCMQIGVGRIRALRVTPTVYTRPLQYQAEETVMTGDSARQEGEVLIDGRLYDVKSFKHPGGSIIKFFGEGGDATDAFTQFHHRSLKARKYLDTLPSRPAPKGVIEEVRRGNPKHTAKLEHDFKAFNDQLITEGWYKPAPWHVAYRIAEIIVLFAIAVKLLSIGGLAMVLGIPLMGN